MPDERLLVRQTGTAYRVDANVRAERSRGLIMLRAVLETVGERLDEDSLDDLGLLVRINELKDLVDQDLQQLAKQQRQKLRRSTRDGT